MSEQQTTRATETDFEQLAARIRSGDRQAEGELVEIFGRGLKMLLRARCDDSAEADDIYQETFRVTLERLRSEPLDHPDKLPQFVRGTAMKLLLAGWRKETRRQTYSDSTAVCEWPDSEPGIVERITGERRRQVVRNLLNELPVARDREILRRFYLANDDKAAICAALELDAAHFDRVLYRARKRLRELIERRGAGGGSANEVGELELPKH